MIACDTADPSVYNQSYAMGDPSGTIGVYRICASKEMDAGLDNCIDSARVHILGGPMRFELSRHEGACGPKSPQSSLLTTRRAAGVGYAARDLAIICSRSSIHRFFMRLE